ncbi:serine protease [Paracoccus aminophilus]|uniref:Serine protease. trypsin family n=1 Tax=Paracoccus aminophilus JCM 7686 TaxID=1367847 RepID=S5XS27_PARAH|nr:serine protease [Paracoccus aminophilus]AGT07927.1 serine protease. trypsin family [Paracoccus aminophilus JCM 7686]
MRRAALPAGLVSRFGLSGWLGRAALMVTLTCAASAAQAELPAQIMRAFNLAANGATDSDLASIQGDLLWTGHYRGAIDGSAGAETKEAVRSFQRSLGTAETGTLDPESRAILAKRAEATRQDTDLSVETSDWTGIRIAIPRGFVAAAQIDGEDAQGLLYEGRAAVPFEIRETRFQSNSAINPRALAKQLVADQDDAEILASGVTGGLGYLAVRVDDLLIYTIMGQDDREMRGVSVAVSASSSWAMRPIVAEVLASTELFAGKGVPFKAIKDRLIEGRYPGMEDRPDWYRSMTASGSGSLVSTEGHVLTNHHVIASCDSLTVNGQPAELIGSDVRLDLALLRVPKFASREPIAFRTEGPKLGESLLVMGYPVFSLTQALNVTDGVVSSTSGFEGSRLSFQITAPVQPGNSGGPVLDRSGRQLAVVAAKAGKSLRAETGIENMAWVIRADAVRDFLNRYQIRFRDSAEPGSVQPTEQVVAAQRDKVFRVECH